MTEKRPFLYSDDDDRNVFGVHLMAKIVLLVSYFNFRPSLMNANRQTLVCLLHLRQIQHIRGVCNTGDDNNDDIFEIMIARYRIAYNTNQSSLKQSRVQGLG